MSTKTKAADTSYERSFDGATMVEVEPGWFVNKAVWALLLRAGIDRCTKREEET